MKNIFLITELFYPNKTSTAYIMTEFAKYFVKTKNVSVICSAAAYDDNVTDEIEEGIDKINMILCDTPKVNKNKFISRIWGALRVTLSFAIRIFVNVKKEDTVFAVTNPFLLVILLAVLKKIKRFNYVLLVHDVFPENAVPAGLVSDQSISYKVLKYVYDWAYAQADQLIVLGRDMKELMVSKVRNNNSIHIIENWYDADLSVDKSFNRNSYIGVNLEGKIVIGFAGNLGRVQKVFDFVKIFSKVENDKLIFLIVGDGAEKDVISEFIEQENLNNIIYLGSKGRNEQSKFLNCFDIGLISLAPNMYGLGVPSKSYNLLYLGKPLLFLGDSNSEIDLLIKDNQIGYSFNWSNEHEIIDYLNSLDSADNTLAINAKKLAEREFNENYILSKLDRLF